MGEQEESTTFTSIVQGNTHENVNDGQIVDKEEQGLFSKLKTSTDDIYKSQNLEVTRGTCQ
jgi:hypothetical protein